MISVLVVEDDPIAGEAHERYVGRVQGFEVAGWARTGREALHLLERTPVDLVLLDLHLPDIGGLQVARRLRAAGSAADVIVVTSVRDLQVVRSSVASGAVQYLLKPFTFAAMREKLEQYARFRASLDGERDARGQGEIDLALASLRGTERVPLPKGMAEETLASVVASLRARPEGAAAGVVGEVAGVSRVTARRYLEHLVEHGLVVRRPQYGGVGRPEMVYLWATPG